MNDSLSGLTPGATYHYVVVATNADGTSTGADLTFTTSVPTGGGPGPGPGPGGTTPARPALAKLMLTPSAFLPVTKKHRAHRGTTISYTDTHRARTTFTVQHRLTGVRKGKRCVARRGIAAPPSPRAAHAWSC